jgi:hypothetical protein
MPEGHIIIRMDRDDYTFLQPGYARLHLTPSQIIRLAMDRFLTEPRYRSGHPFALPRPVVNEDLDDAPAVGAALDPVTLSVRVDRDRRDVLKTLLDPPEYGLGAFCRGALVAPGHVLESPYLEQRMLILCAERDIYFWQSPPLHELEIDLDTQPDISHRRGQARRRR